MTVKRLGGIDERPGVTRRGALTRITLGAGGAAMFSRLLGQDQPRSVQTEKARASTFAVTENRVVGSTSTTNLIVANQYGNPTALALGTVLACPQSCAALRPGYTDLSLDAAKIYLNTSEWIREIIYTPDDLSGGTLQQADVNRGWRAYRRKLGYARVMNDASTSGCGHISKSVVVTCVSLQADGTLKPTTYGGAGATFSSIAIGSGPAGAIYSATAIYISATDLSLLKDPGKPGTTVVQAVVKEIGSDTRPIDVSACPPVANP